MHANRSSVLAVLYYCPELCLCLCLCSAPALAFPPHRTPDSVRTYIPIAPVRPGPTRLASPPRATQSYIQRNLSYVYILPISRTYCLSPHVLYTVRIQRVALLTFVYDMFM